MIASTVPPPDPRRASSPSELIEYLVRLRCWAGQPSLRKLRALADPPHNGWHAEPAVLPASTISDVLAGKSLPKLPKMTFVEAFVTACAKAGGCPDEELPDFVDRWRDAWRTLARTERATRPGCGRDGSPAQLPPDTTVFTGRSGEIDALCGLALERGSGTSATGLIDGPAGTGKSALAVHVAHRIAHRFPDGQLYVDLGGTEVGPAPLDVLKGWLRALGVTSPLDAGLPETFRSVLAGRRLLIVLDNVFGAAQLRPLLPAAPGCAVLVTSRRVLGTVDAAIRVHLDELTEPESVDLLARLAGNERITAEPAAASTIARLCGYLPLALRIAGARLRARPDWPASALAARLKHNRLDELEADDLSVRSRYAAEPLPSAARELFRLLGTVEAPAVDVPTAAALADLPAAEAERALGCLVDAHLLRPTGPGCFRMPVLVHLYAREQALTFLAGIRAREPGQSDRAAPRIVQFNP